MNDSVLPSTDVPSGQPPTNAAEARAVLDSRMADKQFGAKLFAGDVATKTEYRELRALINNPAPTDAVAAAMSNQDHP
ncbi:MAG TPA: hypothetical protein VK747_16085, partial [Blastocatellia bacterium]|nr:hypothetical protein [Blastocatellia bacterium]